jgi:hypothetical protein
MGRRGPEAAICWKGLIDHEWKAMRANIVGWRLFVTLLQILCAAYVQIADAFSSSMFIAVGLMHVSYKRALTFDRAVGFTDTH